MSSSVSHPVAASLCVWWHSTYSTFFACIALKQKADKGERLTYPGLQNAVDGFQPTKTLFYVAPPTVCEWEVYYLTYLPVMCVLLLPYSPCLYKPVCVNGCRNTPSS